jgi:hypothetical protein
MRCGQTDIAVPGGNIPLYVGHSATYRDAPMGPFYEKSKIDEFDELAES